MQLDFFPTHPDISVQTETLPLTVSPNHQKDQLPKTEVPEVRHKIDPTGTTTTLLVDPETPGTHPPAVLRRPDLHPPKEQDPALVSRTAAPEIPVQKSTDHSKTIPPSPNPPGNMTRVNQ